jgi:hypothetical protein
VILSKRIRLTAAVAVGTLALAGSATAALVGLPADGSQVNNDPAAGIDPSKSAGVADTQGGTVTAGNLMVPWATFEQQGGPVPGAQQIFVRAFKGGQWVTQGASLNIDPKVKAEAPSIDFAGTGRTVPWDSWYEPNATLGGKTQIFASRFAAATNQWLPAGQDRGSGLPSLNINLDRDAENPAVVGGAAVAGNDPVPWVAWQEIDGAQAVNQIFVSRAVKQTTGCSGPPGSGMPVNGFCWLEVGLPRLDKTGGSSAAGDSTLNVDPTRDGIEPDDAFTGGNDTVPWVVWYEQHPTHISGLHSNEMVFAAKAVKDDTVRGGFKWVAVGNGTQGQTNLLDTGAAHGFGSCAATASAEAACSLNADSTRDAEDPRVAAGSLAAGSPTVPWVVWSEATSGGHPAIFVSRLVGGDHFELFNGGQPVSNTSRDASRPDITFAGHTPVITWLETVGGMRRTFEGHFEGPAFHLDTPADGIAAGADGVADQRAPVSSTCTANPFNADGTSCQANAAGTPFFLTGDQDASLVRLHAHALAPEGIVTGAVSGVTATTATVAGAVNPAGATVKVHFDYGTSTAYGSQTPDQRLGPAVVSTGFTAALASLPAGTTIHYRAVAQSDFGTTAGSDVTFVTAGTPAGGKKVLTLRLIGLPGVVKLHRLHHRVLVLRMQLSRPATLAVDLRRGHHRVRHLALGTRSGTVRISLSLRGLRTGRYVLRISAHGVAGGTVALSRTLKLVH